MRLGVIGDPVEHSLSPEMMNAALRHCGLPHEYARLHIRPNELSECLHLIREREWVGMNVTVPHKRAALAAMDWIDDTASAIGAINTVQFRHGKLRGFNTDGIGFSKAVREEFGVDVRSLRVLILGSGGASRAIASACEQPRVWSRRGGEDLRNLARDAELIVNATPVGFVPGEPPLLKREELRQGQLVYDTIYNPARTRLLEEAVAAGARVGNGISMLLHQGAAAFEIWFNRSAPLDVMRAALSGD